MSKFCDLFVVVLLIIGGLNWGILGIANVNVIQSIIGPEVLVRILYVIVGLAALWGFRFFKELSEK